MALPITLPFILLISAYSLYYDFKERRVPNFIIFSSMIILTIFYLYLTVFFEATFLITQIRHFLFFFFIVFMFYLAKILSPGDAKLLLVLAYAIPYMYLKHIPRWNIPHLSIIINLAAIGIAYLLYKILFDKKFRKILRDKKLIKDVAFQYLKAVAMLSPIILASFLILKNLRAMYLSPALAIIITLLLIRSVANLYQKVISKIKKKEIIILIGIASFVALSFINFRLNLLINTAMLLLIFAMNFEKFFEKEEIPAAVFIVIAVFMTIFLEGSITNYF